MESISDLKEFYNREYIDSRYANVPEDKRHPFYPTLQGIIDRHGLHDKRCLEIGGGRGKLQDIVDDYHAIDISGSVAKNFHKPFCQASASSLPFASGSFDVIWTYAVLEHVPQPEKAIEEMARVLKNDGYLILRAAWQCRPWAADGYPVRPYSDFNLGGKLIKASIPVRNSLLFRSMYVFPARAARFLQLLTGGNMGLRYGTLKPNYEKFWMSDSDAINSIDPYEAYLWFKSRKNECLSHSPLSAFLIRTGTLVFRIKK